MSKVNFNRIKAGDLELKEKVINFRNTCQR